jgi:hypothetical protein
MSVESPSGAVCRAGVGVDFDDWHVGGPPRGKSRGTHPGKAATLWEIHPITDIRFTPRPH